MHNPISIGQYSSDSPACLFCCDRLQFLKSIPLDSASLIITSPPYNIGKSYEKPVSLEQWIADQSDTIKLCYDLLKINGSLCWQTGNYIAGSSEIIPLDVPIFDICNKLGLKLRNRIIWNFGHGLHCKKRFSGRYETILWFTKSDDYVFNLDAVRIPQKYKNKKYFRGPKKGQLSCNPLGKNPGDFWTDTWSISNIKHNHPEKTNHPCQFPVELVSRLILSLTNNDDLIIDPYCGSGSSLCAAIDYGRRAAGCDIMLEYINIAAQRINASINNKRTNNALDLFIQN